MKSIYAWFVAGLAAVAPAQQVTGSKAAAHGPLEAELVPERVMGIWSGIAMDTEGEVYPFDLTLAQWDTELYGFGTMTVDPTNSLTGRPSVRLRGTLEGEVLNLGMSGILDNLCTESSTAAFDLRLRYDPASEAIVSESVALGEPVGCGLLLTHLFVTRQDRPHVPGNASILGTWDGKVDGVYGWFFAPPVMTPPRKSFFTNGAGQLEGFMETTPGGLWAEMNLTWDPATGQITYVYECVTIYVLEGFVDGNKVSGVERYAGASNEEFFGVFVHTLRPFFVPPGPGFSAFCPWTE